MLKRSRVGAGKKPTTWRTLVDVLRQSQLVAEAGAIEVYFQ